MAAPSSASADSTNSAADSSAPAGQHAADNPASTSVSSPVNPVPHSGDHDRVAMLSLRADGTPDQNNPEFIGDKDIAEAAAKRQFAEQAVSAVDSAERSAAAGPVTLIGQEDGSVKEVPATTGEPDAATEDLKAKHDDAAAAAEAAASAAVEALHPGTPADA